MLICLILLVFCQLCATLSAFWLLPRYLNRKQAEIEAKAEEVVRSWAESPKPGEPSKIALLLDSMGTVVGSAAARSLMLHLNQTVSSTAMVANGESAPLQAQQNPLLGLLMGGKRGKGAAVMRLAELLGPMLMKGNGTGAPGPSQTSFIDRIKGT